MLSEGYGLKYVSYGFVMFVIYLCKCLVFVNLLC